MKQKIIITLCLAAAFALLTACSAGSDTNNNAGVVSNINTAGSMDTNLTVEDLAMSGEKDIVENASASKNHTTLATAVKTADLSDTLKGAGPFTVFAPTNAAFGKLPGVILENLLKPEGKRTLTFLLNYHVVPGKHDAASIAKAIEEGGGKATFNTVQGTAITASMEGKDIVLTDEVGGKSRVIVPDVMQSNGVIHVVDSVLMLDKIGLL